MTRGTHCVAPEGDGDSVGAQIVRASVALTVRAQTTVHDTDLHVHAATMPDIDHGRGTTACFTDLPDPAVGQQLPRRRLEVGANESRGRGSGRRGRRRGLLAGGGPSRIVSRGRLEERATTSNERQCSRGKKHDKRDTAKRTDVQAQLVVILRQGQRRQDAVAI